MGGIVSRDAGESAAGLLAQGLRDAGQSLSTAAQQLAEGMRGAALYLSIAIVVVAAIIAYTAHSIIA